MIDPPTNFGEAAEGAVASIDHVRDELRELIRTTSDAATMSKLTALAQRLDDGRDRLAAGMNYLLAVLKHVNAERARLLN